MSLIPDGLKKSLVNIVTGRILGDIAHKAAAGEYGAKVQKVYLATAGYKTYTGMVLVLVFGALDYFEPQLHSTTLNVSEYASMGLVGLGLLDKAWRNEPIFPVWLLESVGRISGAITWVQITLIPFADPIIEHFAPGCVKCDSFENQAELMLAAGAAACAYVNRLAAASRSTPPPLPGDAK